MKSLDFIFIGASKNASFKELERLYHDKIRRYVPSAVKLIKDSPEKNTALKCRKESEAVLDQIKPGDFLVVCDEHGKSLHSVTLAKALSTWQGLGKRMVIAVGGAYGVSPDLRERANVCLRLSDFTLPHELARVVLLEQLYRALTIQAGEKYHHE